MLQYAYVVKKGRGYLVQHHPRKFGKLADAIIFSARLPTWMGAILRPGEEAVKIELKITRRVVRAKKNVCDSAS